jgi:hypothetical protein
MGTGCQEIPCHIEERSNEGWDSWAFPGQQVAGVHHDQGKDSNAQTEYKPTLAVADTITLCKPWGKGTPSIDPPQYGLHNQSGNQDNPTVVHRHSLRKIFRQYKNFV